MIANIGSISSMCHALVTCLRFVDVRIGADWRLELLAAELT